MNLCNFVNYSIDVNSPLKAHTRALIHQSIFSVQIKAIDFKWRGKSWCEIRSAFTMMVHRCCDFLLARWKDILWWVRFVAEKSITKRSFSSQSLLFRHLHKKTLHKMIAQINTWSNSIKRILCNLQLINALRSEIPSNDFPIWLFVLQMVTIFLIDAIALDSFFRSDFFHYK